MNSHNRIEIYIEITNFSCMKSIIVIKYCLFVRRRHVGMADDADSKSVGRKPVWVQVPLPAYKRPQVSNRKSEVFLFAAHRFLKPTEDASRSPGIASSVILPVHPNSFIL